MSSNRSDIFEFKDFSMLQAPSGQRINTDSCVFAGLIQPRAVPQNILDIGTGTGVVALMLAIRFPNTKILAIEPEIAILDVAKINFENSRWRSQIETSPLSAQELSTTSDIKFDFIACNPPYFHNSTQSPNRLRMVARHTVSLDPDELFKAFASLLSSDGCAWMSCPSDTKDTWIESGQKAGLFYFSKITLFDHPNSKPHVSIFGWSFKSPEDVEQKSIVYRKEIRGEQSDWMKEFRRQWYPARYEKSN